MAAIDAPPPALPPGMLAAMSDATLVGLIAAGSDDAFAALDERYRRKLVRFARGFVAGGTADAEDAVQEAMVRAVRALRTGSRPEAVGPWLHRITRNCALDLSAARRRHPVVELADHAHPPAEDPQSVVERRLGMDGLVADVVRLPASQRSALVLRELEGRSYADIADQLDVTVPAVKSLLVRARQGLKQARDGARAAALLPFPALARVADRLTALFEPVAATATPKVACVAAVIAAGSVPMVSSGTTAPPPAPASPSARIHVNAVQGPRSAAAKPTVRDPGVHPLSPAAAIPALRRDCADGTIDGTYSPAELVGGLSRLSQHAGEYADCRAAIQQALLKK